MGLQKSSLDIQQAKQNLATGAYTQQSAQAGAQQAQQEMGERQLLQKVMLEGKDPDGNPLRDENGEVNAPALHAFASKYLPLTGQGVTQAIVNTQDARLKLNDTVRGLNQNYRNDLSGVLRSLINSNDDAAAIGAKLTPMASKTRTQPRRSRARRYWRSTSTPWPPRKGTRRSITLRWSSSRRRRLPARQTRP